MDKVSKRKFVLVILFLSILVVVFLLVGKITFAFLADEISGDVKQSSEITATGDTLLFVKGTPITLNANSDTFTSTGKSLSSTTKPSAKLVANSSSKTADATYAVGFKITGNTFSYTDSTKPELILTIKDESGNIITTSSDTLSYVTVTDRSGEEISGFDVTNALGNYNVVVEKPINTNSSTTGTTHVLTYTLTLVNYEFDQSVNEGSSISLEAVVQKDKIDAVKLSDYVKMLHGGINGKSNIYFHDSTLENGAGDNSYRYSGSYESVNNYVCFGSNEEVCPYDNLYRIIGVFGEQVKLIKADYAKASELGTSGDYESTYKVSEATSDWGTNKGSNTKEEIGGYYWNYNNGNLINANIWANSKLNKENLNGTYLNGLGTTWQSKIAMTTWKVGGNTYANIMYTNPTTAYQNEIVNPVSGQPIVQSKIGLMYVSDYYYGARQNNWTKHGCTTSSYPHSSGNYGEEYDYRSAINENWMYGGLWEWTISRRSDCDEYAFDVYYDGDVSLSDVSLYGYAVRPVFYLEADVKLAGGNGTKTSPYRIKNEGENEGENVGENEGLVSDNVSVVVTWDDDTYQDIRPESVMIRLLGNEELAYDTVEVGVSNNWRYNWTDLPLDYVWTVGLEEIEGYDITIELVGITFQIILTYIENDTPPPDNPPEELPEDPPI